MAFHQSLISKLSELSVSSSPDRSPIARDPDERSVSSSSDSSSMTISSGESVASLLDTSPVTRAVDEQSVSSRKEGSDAPFRKMVQRLWESGEYSDLTIMAVDRDFKVHKNIICPASRYFKAVCSEELNGTPTYNIGVSEVASVIEELLRNIYGHGPDVAKLLEDPVAAVRHLCEVLTAAKKYQITCIEDQIYGVIPALAFEKREYPHAHRLTIAIGQVLFEYRKVVDPSTLEWYVRETYDFFWRIVYDDVGWQLLTLSPNYYNEVMRKVYEEYPELEDAGPSSEEKDRERLKMEGMAKFLKLGLET